MQKLFAAIAQKQVTLNNVWRAYLAIAETAMTVGFKVGSPQLLQLCTSAPLHLCTSAPLHLCSSAALQLCTSAPLHLCTSVLVVYVCEFQYLPNRLASVCCLLSTGDCCLCMCYLVWYRSVDVLTYTTVCCLLSPTDCCSCTCYLVWYRSVDIQTSNPLSAVCCHLQTAGYAYVILYCEASLDDDFW